MKKKWLLDSFALLAYLRKENNYQRVRDILSQGKDIIMNEINIGEVYYIISRKRSQQEAEYFLNNVLPLLAIRLISNSFSLVMESARIKARFPISYADAFTVATALGENAVIITGDPEFKHVESIIEVEWM